MLAMVERFLRIEKCVRSALIAAGSEVTFTEAEIQLLRQLSSALKPAKFAVDRLNQRDATLLSAERINEIVFNCLEADTDNAFAQNFLGILKPKIKERRPSNLIHLMEYLNDPNYIKSTTFDIFGMKPQKKKVQELTTELLGRLFSVEVTDENQEQNAVNPITVYMNKMTESAFAGSAIINIKFDISIVLYWLHFVLESRDH